MMKVKKIMIFICVLTTLIAAIISLDCGLLTYRVQTGSSDYVILIDPGHGGMDGGASCSDGTLEKDINLAIAKKLAAEAEQYNCSVILTRDSDEWLCDTDEGSIRSRKTADMAARREIIRKYRPDVTVSVHLNSFKEDPDVRGAQVFYPGGSEESCKFAETMQQRFNEELQPDNPRTAMTRDGVFIFREVLGPMIIAECGFMSNPEEAARLKDDEYQQKLGECIMSGIAEFAGLEKPEPVEIIDSSR